MEGNYTICNMKIVFVFVNVYAIIFMFKTSLSLYNTIMNYIQNGCVLFSSSNVAMLNFICWVFEMLDGSHILNGFHFDINYFIWIHVVNLNG